MKASEPVVARGKTIDDVLIELSAAGYSRAEISRRLGGALTPERVHDRINELLEAPDWLTDVQQERALLQLVRINLMELRTNIRKDHGDYLDGMKLQLAYIDRIFERYTKRAEATQEQLNTYNTNVGRVLGRVVDIALSYMRGALRDEIESDRWDELVQDALMTARTEISRHEVEA